MPSSTSSSSHRQAFRLFAAMVLLLGAGLLVTQTFVRMIGARAPESVWVSGPARQAMKQLDDVATRMRGHRNVIVFGSSRTARGFDRVAYEAEIRRRCGFDVQAWRFGFGFIGISPTTQAIMADHIRDALAAAGTGWDLAIIEFTPFQNTYRISEGEYGAGQDEWMVFLSSPEALMMGLPYDVDRTLRLLTYELFYEESSPHRLTRFAAETFAERFVERSPPKRPLPEVSALLRELRRSDPMWAPVGNWRADLRGAGWYMSSTQLSEQGLRKLKAIKRALAPEREAFLEEDRQWRIDCCDAHDLDLDPAQLSAFRRLLRTFERMSAATAVYLPPENRARLPVSEAGDQRVAAFLDTLPHPVIDLSRDPHFSDTDFYDTNHLDEIGAAKLSSRLAEQTASILCAHR